jgi:hypothetical protein
MRALVMLPRAAIAAGGGANRDCPVAPAGGVNPVLVGVGLGALANEVKPGLKDE